MYRNGWKTRCVYNAEKLIQRHTGGCIWGGGGGEVEVRRVLKWGGGGGGGWREMGEEGGGRMRQSPGTKITATPLSPPSLPPPPPLSLSLTLSTCRLSPWGQERSRTLSSLLPLLHSIPTPYAARHAGSTFPPEPRIKKTVGVTAEEKKRAGVA